MKQLSKKLAWLFVCFQVVRGSLALAQTTQPAGPAQTADTYVRPYTELYQYGSNMGYYGDKWNDEGLAGLLQQAGGHSLRVTLPEWLVEYFGYNARVSTFNAYANTYGMSELSCFVGDPVPSHRDFTTYPGCTGPSKMFAHLYEPIWNPDGTVNQNNYYAYYLYQLLQLYGDKVRFWEVMNEPDFANGASGSAWLTRAPTAAEQINTQAPFYHYVRMLRISYEVIKKYHPETYITVGAGYPEYIDALMRYTDEPTGGAVTAQYPRTGGAYFDVISFHAYPNYSLHYWDNSIGGFRYTRTSDYAVQKVLEYKNQMTDVLAKYHYDGTTHPTKYITLCESNVSRRTCDDRISSDLAQLNFGIKSLVLTQKNDIKQFYYYTVGETVDAPAATQTVSGSEEIGLMGLYENLNRDAPGAAKKVPLGHAFATTSQLLYGYKYDAARTAALALPASIDGAAFGKNGQYVYVLWAKALIDKVEQATATYSFPAAWNLSSVQRYEWNYSATNVRASQPALGVALSTTPSFFVGMAAVPPVAACTATGTILREQWDNVAGPALSDIPMATAPNGSSQLPQLEFATTTGFNYGARVRGYLCAPVSGAYTFFIAGDDQAELYLSPDADPAKKTRIASCTGWTASLHDFTRYPGQQSAVVQLVAGQKYYIEALHKQSWGAGYVSVAWQLPGGVRQEPIPGAQLSPFVPGAVTPPVSSACPGTGGLLREAWTNVPGATLADVPVATAPATSAALPQFEATDQFGFHYGARVRGYICAPQTGTYTFAIAGDDQAQLFLSPDADPAHKVRIASCLSWTASARDFTRYAEQQSAPVPLVAGQRYYIEALHKQGWGPGYLAVAWRLPNGTTEVPIPGSQLVPFVVAAGSSVAAPPVARASALRGQGAELSVYPNPFTQQATVRFGVATAGPVSLAIYDLRGRLVRQLFAGEGEAGITRQLTLPAEGLSAGLYVLRLKADHNVLTQKLVLNK